jgi:hypothetical protein
LKISLRKILSSPGTFRPMKYSFLISSERSGSNLLCQMIGANSTISAPPPSHLFRLLSPLEGHLEYSELCQRAQDILNFKLSKWDVEFSLEELLDLPRQDLFGLLTYIFEKQAIFESANHLFIKEVRTFNLIPFLSKHFPTSKFIWLVRDPRDMALSWKKSPVHRGEVPRAAGIWNSDQEETFRVSADLTGRILQTSYEELLSDSKFEIQRICTFLGISFEMNMLNYYSNAKSAMMSESTDNWKNLNYRSLF